jgi:hypothetical protein
VNSDSENESWLINKGDEVIQKKATLGAQALTPMEKLIYCLWVADYGMCNAGDLQTASDVYADFHSEGARLSKQLGLAKTAEAFSFTKEKLEKVYFERFQSICDELRSAS